MNPKLSEIIGNIRNKVHVVLSLQQAEVLKTLLENRKKSLSSVINKIPKVQLLSIGESNGEINSADLIGNEI